MIQRVVLIKLKDAYRTDVNRRQIAEHSREVLGPLPQVRALEVVTAADPRTESDWDVCILVRFDDLEAVEAYRVHEVHRKYVDIYLKPLMAGIRAYNFSCLPQRQT